MTEKPRLRRRSRPSRSLRLILTAAGCGFCLLFGRPGTAAGQEADSGVNVHWGGHLRAIATVSDIGDDTIYQFARSGAFFDGQAELRLKNELFFGSRWSLETHYEAVAAGGDTRRSSLSLRRQFAGYDVDWLIPSSEITDDQRFFDFSHTLVDNDSVVVYHRLDRLNLTYAPSWGSLRIGRQALTWGNGMVFNPMDLFDPFAPTAIQRDYKLGEDMILAQAYFGRHDGQAVILPRRDPSDGDIDGTRSTYAGKLHVLNDDWESDLMVARNYDDDVLGAGIVGTLGGAAWRLNTVYTAVSKDYDRDNFLQVVANMDYAWTWGGKNIYGLLEYYYNGLGRSGDYGQALHSAYTLARLSRGDLFGLGRNYLAARLQIELHPLLRNDWTLIVNLDDPSLLLQPQWSWDVATDLQLIVGITWHEGRHGTEYGGFDVSAAGHTVTVSPADQAFLWLTYSF